MCYGKILTQDTDPFIVTHILTNWTWVLLSHMQQSQCTDTGLRWRKVVQETKLGEQAAHAQKARTLWWLSEKRFYSVMEGAPRCMISRWTVLRLLGIKVQFQASSTFCVQPVSGLCSCGQQFSSGGGLLPIETRLCGRPLSISFRELGVQWFCCVVDLWS